jgi:hypothetical protein
MRVFPYMRLYDTTVDAVKYDHDETLAAPKKGTRGVRAMIVANEKAWLR